MAKHKVSELEGRLLDTAVALADGWTPSERRGWMVKPAVTTFGVQVVPTILPGVHLGESTGTPHACQFNPSGDWQQGGPIIASEQMALWCTPSPGKGPWVARIARPTVWSTALAEESGPTPLIAAMRAYVASKLGEEVELP